MDDRKAQEIADAITDPRSYSRMRAFKGNYIEWLNACARADTADIKRALFADIDSPDYLAGIHRYNEQTLTWRQRKP